MRKSKNPTDAASALISQVKSDEQYKDHYYLALPYFEFDRFTMREILGRLMIDIRKPIIDQVGEPYLSGIRSTLKRVKYESKETKA